MGVDIADGFSEQGGELSPTASESGVKIPIELLVPPPRKVHLRLDRRAAVISKLIFAILLDLPGIAFLVYAAVDPLFIRYAQPRPATIVYLRISHNTKHNTFYHVGYSYVFDGLERAADENADYRLYHSLRLGQNVEVCAARFGPFHFVQMKSGGTGFGPLGAAALGLIWNIIFFLYLLVLVFEPRRLARTGTPTIGRITSKHISGRNSTSYCLKYTFRTAKGWKQEWPDYVPRKVYARANVGDEVIVVYVVKSDGGCRSDIYDFSDFEAGW